jgi:sortase (surface protein transpeptidase)
MLMLYPSFSDLFCRLYEQELRASWAEKYYLEPLEITAGSEREFQGMVLKIPAIGLDTAVQKGISPQVLKKTPGWFEESALPGQGTRQLLPI